MPGYEITQAGLISRDVDVLVLGGGMAGSFAAMAARQGGASVVLVEPTNALGGQGTAGGVAGFCGDTERVNGLFAELIARLSACGRIDPYDPNDDRRAYDLEVCAFFLQEFVVEKGVEIWLHARAIDACAKLGRVTSVLVSCGATLVDVRPKVVIDATGNAIIPDMIGLETIHLGPRKQLPMSLYFTLWDTHRRVTPFLPPGCPNWDADEDLPMTSLHSFADGRVEVKMKVVGFDAADGFSLSQAEIHARRQMMGLVYYLQTRGYRGRHGALSGRPLDTHVLASVSRAIGQREGRRIVGRFTISDADARTALVCDDAIAVGTYHLDYHWTDTEKRAGTGITDMVEPYHIPLAAMTPASVDNVLCPGRSLSGEQLAMSSYRVMATCAQTGFGAGTAAALAAERDGDVTGVDRSELSRRIASGGQSLDLADYGDYLRCLRFSDEAVSPPREARTLPPPVTNDNHSALSLVQMRDGTFFAARISESDGSRVEIAVRRRTVWSPHAVLNCGTDLRAVYLSTNDAGLAIAALTSDGRSGRIDAELDAHVGCVERPVEARFVSMAEGGSEVAGAWLGDDVAALPGFIRQESSPCRMRDGRVVGLAIFRSDADPNRFDLVALAEDRSPGGRWLMARVGRDVDASIEPAFVATGVGCAVIWQNAEGELRFWEGPIERFSRPYSPAPTIADLKARPYRDHLILSSQ